MGRTNKSLPFILLFFLLICCREEEPVVVEIPVETPNPKVNIVGYVQKGPFINGTSIVIVELNDSLGTTGKTFFSQVVDNKGSFTASNIELSSPYIQLVANGFYFDEVKGDKSIAQLTLFALADTASAQRINVNVLSHLEKDRVLYLVGKSNTFAKAKKQAQQEVLSIFGIVKEDMGYAESLDISRQGEDNAILLAISAILQGNSSVGELSELLAEITFDIREDGKLDSDVLKSQLKQNAMGLDLNSIRQNVQERYQELGVEATIPAFEKYIDSDGDGILNKDDDNTPDEFVFEAVLEAEKNTVYATEHITLSGLPYPVIAKITNGMLLKNGQIAEGEIIYLQDGDIIQVQLKSPLGWAEKATAILQIGDYSTSFEVTNKAYPWATAISGFVENGPFINGTSISLSEQDTLLTATNTVYTTNTTDGRGSYQINDIQVNYPWAQLEAKGYYYNMISGKNSEGELQLAAYTDVSSTEKANVNVLTHIESRRIKYLVNTGIPFTEAKKQALKEVLAIFEIDQNNTTAEHYSFTQSNTESAILIAVSAILQGYENTGTFYALLTNISIDLEVDGKLDDGTLGSALINNAFYLNVTAIRQNLLNKYKKFGAIIQIPDFESYINHFVQNTSYTFNNPITYPDKGLYGENLLAGEKFSYVVGSNYSLAANLPIGAKLKIVVKGGYRDSDFVAVFYSGTEVNYKFSYDITGISSGTSMGTFEAIKSGAECDARLELRNTTIKKVTIEYYEYGSAVPTKTKEITVTY